MISLGDYGKIFDTVVHRVAIDMVNFFAGIELTAQMLFDYPPMVKHPVLITLSFGALDKNVDPPFPLTLHYRSNLMPIARFVLGLPLFFSLTNRLGSARKKLRFVITNFGRFAGALTGASWVFVDNLRLMASKNYPADMAGRTEFCFTSQFVSARSRTGRVCHPSKMIWTTIKGITANGASGLHICLQIKTLFTGASVLAEGTRMTGKECGQQYMRPAPFRQTVFPQHLGLYHITGVMP